MIVVRVELWSAVDGTKTELARMHICNDGTSVGPHHNYTAEAFRGRSCAALDRLDVQRKGELRNWPSASLHVWNLVHAVLGRLGYSAGATP